jgi:hypothetical protein
MKLCCCGIGISDSSRSELLVDVFIYLNPPLSSTVVSVHFLSSCPVYLFLQILRASRWTKAELRAIVHAQLCFSAIRMSIFRIQGGAIIEQVGSRCYRVTLASEIYNMPSSIQSTSRIARPAQQPPGLTVKRHRQS